MNATNEFAGEALTIGDAARLAGVDVKTIRGWIDDGGLKVFRRAPLKRRRILRGTLLEFMKSCETSAVADTSKTA